MARGRVNQCPTFPFAVARAEDLAPTTTAPSTSCRERHFSTSPERRGEEMGSPALWAFARRPEREGSLAPGFREEDRH